MSQDPTTVKTPRHPLFFRRVVIACIAFVVLICLVVGFFLDAIAARTVSMAGTRVLGVATSLKSMHLAVIGGTSSIDGLAIAQPAGFGSDSMLAVNYAGVTANLKELLAENIVLEEINIRGVLVNLVEKSGKVNLQVVADNLSSPTKPVEPAKPTAPADDSKRTVTIKKLSVTNIKVLVQGNDYVTTGKTLEVTIPDIEVADLGTKTPASKVAAQVSAQLMSRLMMAIVKAQIQGLPSNMLSGLEAGTNQLGGLIQSVGDGSILNQSGDSLKSAEQKLEQGLGNLFGGNKK